MRTETSPTTIDEYISTYPNDVQAKLQKIRKLIHSTIPTEAGEKISYGIPTFTYHGNLVHFAAYAKHIGLYPGAAPVAAFKDKLKGYTTSKGTIQFQLDQPIPYDLIKEIVLFCVASRDQS